MQREIPKLTKCPPLTEQLQHLLTKLVYIPNDPILPSDCIFVFGNRHTLRMAHQIENLLNHQVASLVIISGGSPKFEDSAKATKSEAEDIRDSLTLSNFSATKFFLENTSTNTLENVQNSLNLFPPKMKSLTFICNWYISRRARLTLFKFLPHSIQLRQFAIPTPIPEEDAVLSPNTWYETSIGKNRTFSEYVRLKTYGLRGDIILDQETLDLLHQIDELV